jgi:hypothetical protein
VEHVGSEELQPAPPPEDTAIEGIRESAIFCCLEMREHHLA